MYTATGIVCVCTGILALLTVVGGYSCTITQIYFYICFACLYYSYGSFKHKCEFCEIRTCLQLMHTHSCMYTPSHCHTHVHTKHTHVRTCTAFCNASFLLARQENLTNPAAYVCSTVVTAFKYTITDQPQPIDVLLKACIGDFLKTLGDPELVGPSSDIATSHFLFSV